MHAVKFTILNIFDCKIWWHERHPEGRASITVHPALNPCSPASVCVALTPPGPSSEGTLVLPCLASLTSGRRSSTCTFPSQATSLERTGRALLTPSPVRHTDPFGRQGWLGTALWSLCHVSLALSRPTHLACPLLAVVPWPGLLCDWRLEVGITEEGGAVAGGSGRWLRSHTSFPVPARARPRPPPPPSGAPAGASGGLLPPKSVRSLLNFSSQQCPRGRVSAHFL